MHWGPNHVCISKWILRLYLPFLCSFHFLQKSEKETKFFAKDVIRLFFEYIGAKLLSTRNLTKNKNVINVKCKPPVWWWLMPLNSMNRNEGVSMCALKLIKNPPIWLSEGNKSPNCWIWGPKLDLPSPNRRFFEAKIAKLALKFF